MRRTRVTVGLVAVAAAAAVLVAAIGGNGSSTHVRASGPFGWLRPAPAPAGWSVARVPSGARLAYPPGWNRIKTDSGTASVALLRSRGRIDAFLNATPRQGTETLANWSRFRPQHNRREGDRGEHLVASTTDAHFRSGRGSCVIDTYTTSKATYREIACLVSSARTSAVVVAAAPSALWHGQAATLERAVSSFVP